MRQVSRHAIILLLRVACLAAAPSGFAAQAGGESPKAPPVLAVDASLRAIAIGQPLEIAVRYGPSRPGAVVVVSLERAGGPEDSGRYYGPVGVIGMIHPDALRAGVGRLHWNGATVGCSPEDSPTECVIEPGRYRLRAALYPHGRFDPTPFLISRPAPRVLLEVLSEPLQISGTPNLAALQGWLRGGASEHVRGQEAGRGFWMMGRSDTLVDPGHDFRREPRGWCMDFRPIAPIQGTLTACAPLNVVSDDGLQIRTTPLALYGKLSLPNDILPTRRAWKAAIELVPEIQVLGYVGWPKGAEGAERSIFASKYRADLLAWFIMLHVPPADASNAVVVRVENDGRACLVGRTASPSLAEFEALQRPCPVRG